jgi:hypothetical protein
VKSFFSLEAQQNKNQSRKGLSLFQSAFRDLTIYSPPHSCYFVPLLPG